MGPRSRSPVAWHRRHRVLGKHGAPKPRIRVPATFSHCVLPTAGFELRVWRATLHSFCSHRWKQGLTLLFSLPNCTSPRPSFAEPRMDYDRKSTVSSFYGGRKSSVDALQSEFPSSSNPSFHPPQPLGRVRHDSASSFYNPNGPSRASVEMLNHAPSAGYNRNSFFDAGREEPVKGGYDEESTRDDGFDVFADFNNAGPRYSTAFGSQQNAG